MLYSQIWDFVAESFILRLNELEGLDATCRVNSPGGSVFAGWGMIAAVIEFTGTLKIKVDGMAASMAAYLIIFVADVECSDVSQFLLHPAQGDVRNDEDQKFLDDVNRSLKSKMKQKFNADIFLSVTGHTIDDMFEKNIDIRLNAKQAKKIGLVKKINRLDPADQQAFIRLAACGHFEEEMKTPEEGKSESVDWENILNNLKN